jgi:hypothetical protein
MSLRFPIWTWRISSVVSPRLSVPIIALTAVFAWSACVSADIVVTPGSLTAANGNALLEGGPDLRFQQVYGASEFGGLGVIRITGLAFRPDAGGGSPFGPDTLPGLRVLLSTTAMAPDGLSSTFADNIGLDETIVFNGDWTRSSADSPGPGGTRAFDIILPFMTAFTYDSAKGNLLVDFIDTSPPLSPIRLFHSVDAHVVLGDSISIIVGGPASATGFPASAGVVTQFEFQSVPEPSGCVLLGLGLAGFLAVVRRQRRMARESGG